jgi:signal transduction histidine kinase
MANKPSRLRLALLVFFAWTLVGLFFAWQARYNPAFTPQLAWSEALSVNLVYYWLWAVTTPVVIWLARRFRFEASAWPASIAAHIAASVALTSLQIVIAEIILVPLPKLRPERSLSDAIVFAFGVNFQSSLPTYWLILFVYLAFDYYAKFHDRELRASQLQTQLSNAQLQALKMQLNPHFLFNTLNSISSLMYHDVEAADAMLTRLGEFLRMTLEQDVEQEIALEKELDFVRRYLEIEQIRFEDRLRVTIDVAQDAVHARVPSLALQPLIENAIHHGIAMRPGGGSIEITAHRETGRLHIAVRNDIAQRSGVPLRERVGLANTRARLEQLYGAQQ